MQNGDHHCACRGIPEFMCGCCPKQMDFLDSDFPLRAAIYYRSSCSGP